MVRLRLSLILGSISAIFSLAVILASIFFLAYSFRTKCEIRAFRDFQFLNEANQTSVSGDPERGFAFSRPVLFTEIQGKCKPEEGLNQAQFQPGPEVEETEPALNPHNLNARANTSIEVKGRAGKAKGQPADPETEDDAFDAEECSIKCSIPKFKECGGVGIASGILQFILAFFYIFWTKKTIPVMSAFFWSHFSVFLCHLTAFTVILHTRAASHPYTKEFYNGTFQTAFCTVIGFNLCFLLGTLIFLCVTCKTKDYHDHCADKLIISEQTQMTSAVSMRNPNTY